jgi:hypothetical protein
LPALTRACALVERGDLHHSLEPEAGTVHGPYIESIQTNRIAEFSYLIGQWHSRFGWGGGLRWQF